MNAQSSTNAAIVVMASVGKMDQSTFAESDREILKMQWSSVFVSKLVSEHIYDAIARKSNNLNSTTGDSVSNQQHL